MFNKLLGFIFKIFLWVVGFIGSIIFRPIFLLLTLIIPDLTDYIETANYMVNNHFLNGIAFAKNVFLNITGFPNSLLLLMVDLFLAKIAFRMSTSIIKFIRNLRTIYMGQRMEE